MRSRLVLLAALVCLLPLRAWSAPMVTASPDGVPVGGTVPVDLFLDPDGLSIGAFLLTFSVSDPTQIGVGTVLLGSLPSGCGGDASGPDAAGRFSFGADCDTAFSGVLQLGSVILSGLELGAELRLDLSNLTTDSFEDVPIGPGVVASVVPEPGSFGLCAFGIACLAARRRAAGRRPRRAAPESDSSPLP